MWLQSEATSSLDEPWRICNVLYETLFERELSEWNLKPS